MSESQRSQWYSQPPERRIDTSFIVGHHTFFSGVYLEQQPLNEAETPETTTLTTLQEQPSPQTPDLPPEYPPDEYEEPSPVVQERQPMNSRFQPGIQRPEIASPVSPRKRRYLQPTLLQLTLPSVSEKRRDNFTSITSPAPDSHYDNMAESQQPRGLHTPTTAQGSSSASTASPRSFLSQLPASKRQQQFDSGRLITLYDDGADEDDSFEYSDGQGAAAESTPARLRAQNEEMNAILMSTPSSAASAVHLPNILPARAKSTLNQSVTPPHTRAGREYIAQQSQKRIRQAQERLKKQLLEDTMFAEAAGLLRGYLASYGEEIQEQFNLTNRQKASLMQAEQEAANRFQHSNETFRQRLGEIRVLQAANRAVAADSDDLRMQLKALRERQRKYFALHTELRARHGLPPIPEDAVERRMEIVSERRQQEMRSRRKAAAQMAAEEAAEEQRILEDSVFAESDDNDDDDQAPPPPPQKRPRARAEDEEEQNAQQDAPSPLPSD